MLHLFRLAFVCVFLVLAQGCSDTKTVLPEADAPTVDATADVQADSVDLVKDTPQPEVVVALPIEVHVTLDGAPSPDTTVSQGGNLERWKTNPEGIAVVTLDLSVPGELVLIASHPDARIRGNLVSPDHTGPFELALDRFDTTDNPDYVFKDPGEPGKSHIIEKCAHCHLTVDETWFASAHKTSASNPLLQDIYQGTASGWGEEEACTLAGGTWKTIVEPGSGDQVMGCVVADAVTDTGGFGTCADCHAPGIDGQLGGRDLLEAKGHSFNYGVHCEVCHHTESIDLDAMPGVAGRLKIVRPSEDPPIPGVGDWKPLTFCPNDDVPNIYMGCVQRDHFRSSDFCAGCHEQQQPALFPGESVDKSRWPNEKIPVHTTFSEWKASVFAGGVSCQGCHMPSAPDEISNGADLQAFDEASTGITGGWPRPPGTTKLHTWSGPRSPEADQLGVPVSVSVEKAVNDGTLVAKVTIQNSAAGHAVPTGEPLRSVLVLVDAACEQSPLKPTGGSAVPDYGGALSWKANDADWTTWDKAKKGDVLRVIKQGSHVDYKGYGSFGDGTFSVEQRGILEETVLGESAVTDVAEGIVTLDPALPDGDVADLVRGEHAHAGRPGAGFARVLLDKDGKRMVPHFKAVDVASDNRLMSQASWTSEHQFESPCAEPTVTVRVIQRAYPLALAQERGWPMRDKLWLEEIK
jgi:hypothetical protein